MKNLTNISKPDYRFYDEPERFLGDIVLSNF